MSMEKAKCISGTCLLNQLHAATLKTKPVISQTYAFPVTAYADTGQTSALILYTTPDVARLSTQISHKGYRNYYLLLSLIPKSFWRCYFSKPLICFSPNARTPLTSGSHHSNKLKHQQACDMECKLYLKLSRQHSPGVDVGGVGFNGFVVAEDLCSGRGGHRGHQQAVPHTKPETHTSVTLPVLFQ